MEISTSSNRVIIKGNIKSVRDQQKIKDVVDGLVGQYKDIEIEIIDSISIISSVIGYFNKLILKDGVRLTLKVGNSELMKLLDDLNLVSLFNARKI